MTEEELKEKAEDYARYTRIKDDKTYQAFDDECISEVQDYEGNYIYLHNRIEKAYKDGYEQGQKEREEQIQIDIEWIDKLEKENEDLEKENGTLKFENHDLCEYIKVLKENEERMKNCFNCKNLKDIGKNCYCEQGLKMYKRNCDKWELAE